MSRQRRFNDFSTDGIRQRRPAAERTPLDRWRALFQVRRGDMTRLLVTLPVLLPLVATVLVLALSALNTQWFYLRAVEAMETQADRYARGMDSFLAGLGNDVSAAAAQLAEQPELDPAALLPEVDSVRLVPLGPLGIADKDNRALDGLRHIERDLLRRALDAKGPVLDAYRAGQDWVYSIASPVPGRGALLVNYAEPVLTRALAELAGSEPVRVELDLNIHGNWHTTVQRGQVEPSPAKGRALLDEKNWAVNVILGDFSYRQWFDRNLWLYLVALIAVVAALLQFVLALHRLRLHRLEQQESLSEPMARERADAESWEKNLMRAAFAEAAEDETADGAANAEPALSDDYLEVRPANAPAPSPIVTEGHFDEHIFRAYDIRGIADTQLGPDVCRDIGLAIAAELKARKQSRVLLARDGRNSSPRIRDAVVEGLLGSGIDVTDLGAVPTPVMHFATHELGVGNGLMITGSHNARECNGIKLVMENQSLTEEAIHGLRDRIRERRFVEAGASRGRYDNKSLAERYIERICEDVVVARRLKVVVDAGNGITGPLAPRVFQALGCVVEPLYCELDGDFPNHDPDPTRPGNLNALQAAVRAKRADLGVAFDGDGDRVVFVTASGDMVYPDQALMILAQDVVARNPGAAVVFDVKCSKHLHRVVSEAGGLPVMCRSGHSYVKNQVEASRAQLGGEFTGHIFIRDRWYGFDDGIYVAARMLELLAMSTDKLHQLLERLPASVVTPELLVQAGDNHKFVIMEQLAQGDYFAGAELNRLDGIRAEYPHGWGLVRASNTGPALSLRFEADTQENLEKIQSQFRAALTHVDPTLTIGF